MALFDFTFSTFLTHFAIIVDFRLWERTFSYTGHCFEAKVFFLSIVFLQNHHLRFLKSFSHMRNATVNDSTYILSHKSNFLFFIQTLPTLHKTDTSIKRRLILVPTVSVLERVDCIGIQGHLLCCFLLNESSSFSSQFNSLFIICISKAKPLSLVRGYTDMKINKHENLVSFYPANFAVSGTYKGNVQYQCHFGTVIS